MPSARDIKKRIKAVGNIRRITKTMQMIATSKFARAQQKATASKPYVEGVFELVTELAAKAGNVSHPLINGPDGGVRGDQVVLVITSDRGLCGPYNGNVLRSAGAHLREIGAWQGGKASAAGFRGVSLELAGKKGAAFAKFNAFPVAATHALGDHPAFDQIERLAQSYMDRFVRGEVSSVRVVFMKFLSTSRQKPEVLQLLPLKPPAARVADGAGAETRVDYEFTPAADRLLADLLPLTVKTTLYQCMNDAIVSEHVARMVAMKSATDNAGKMGKSLNRRYNRARQAQITTELTEIISGAAALD